MLTRSDWLLFFVGLPDGKYQTDQIRLMKGMFLLSQEGPEDLRGLYNFEAYDYGPFDSQIYRDVDQLAASGLMLCEPVTGSSRRLYRLTTAGRQRMADLADGVSEEALQKLVAVKELVTSLDFLSLLRHVYKKYPNYAVNTCARV